MNTQSVLTWLRTPLAARMVFYIGLAAFAASLVWLALRPVAPIELAPDFSVSLLDGSKVRLSDYHGKVLMLNFWASWCAPCKEEMPLLEALYQQQNPDRFALLAINEGENQKTASKFAAELGLTFPIGLDINGDLVEPYNLIGLPITIIIGPNGDIRYNHPGQLYQKTIDEEVTPLIQRLLWPIAGN
jgi:thiol-disulfide isomerase/thioredoxin